MSLHQRHVAPTTDQRISPSSSSSTEQACPPVLRLPQELLEGILSYLMAIPPHTGVLELRATCRELRTRTERSVATWCFSDRTFLLANEESMQALRGISEHPVFSRSIRTIRWSFAKALDLASEHRHSGVHYCEWLSDKRFDMHPVEAPDYLAYRNPLNDDQDQQLKLAEHLVLNQSAFVKGSLDLDRLRTILSNFKAAGNVSGLLAGTPDIFDEFALGYRRLRHAMTEMAPSNAGYRFEVDVCDHRPFQVICDAIQNAAYPVTHLELGNVDTGAPLLSTGFISKNSAFSNLKVLKISLELTRKDMLERAAHRNEGDFFKDHQTNFVDFLRQAPCLETLGIMHTELHSRSAQNSSWGLLEAIAAEVTSSNPMRALRSIQALEFDRFFFWRKTLDSIIHATCTTLKRLQILNELDMMRRWTWRQPMLEAYGGQGLQLSGSIFEQDHEPDIDESVESEDAGSGDDGSSEDGAEDDGSGDADSKDRDNSKDSGSEQTDND